MVYGLSTGSNRSDLVTTSDHQSLRGRVFVFHRCHHLYDDIWILIYFNIKTNYDSITKNTCKCSTQKRLHSTADQTRMPDGGLSLSGRQLVDASRRNAVNRDRVIITNDLEGHSPVAGLFKCNPSNICATFYTISTDNVLARSLCISKASCV